MAIVGRLRDAAKSAGAAAKEQAVAGLGSAGAFAKAVAVKIAVAALVVAAVLVIGERAGHDGGAPASVAEAAPVRATAAAQPALLTRDRAAEQFLICRYTVTAAFGAPVFAETDMDSKRLIRISGGTEVWGSCAAAEGGRVIGCGGLRWEYDWIRVWSGTTVGWSPASCYQPSMS